ncbi:MAG: Uma2 family endonuclease [Chloroflexota bacterium]
MAIELPRYKFTVEEYEAMGRAGILDEDARVELIEGEIIQMAPIGPDHMFAVVGANAALLRRFDDVAWVSPQNPIRIGDRSQPQPDLVLLRIRGGRDATMIPSVDDVILVIEVSDTTLHYDRGVKLPLYARAGIPEVWQVDVAHQLVYCHREPGDDGYRVVQTLRAGDRIAPLAFPDRDLAVDDLLRPRS